MNLAGGGESTIERLPFSRENIQIETNYDGKGVERVEEGTMGGRGQGRAGR